MGPNDRENIDLGGTWQIAFDQDNVGLNQNWMGAGYPLDQAGPVQVPGIWNLSYPDKEGIAFYRTTFTVPESWGEKAILLDFEGAIYTCQAWVDGQFAGSHEGGYTPFWLDVSGLVQPGKESTLIVRVAVPSRTQDVDGINLYQAPLSKHSWYYTYGGLWGRVNLAALPKLVCQDMIIDPNLHDELVQLDLGFHNRRGMPLKAELRIRVTDPRGEAAWEQNSRITAQPGVTHFNYTVQLPRALAWSGEQPNLYRLETWLTGEDGSRDYQTSTFGMRDFTVHDGVFFLNGEQIYIRGILLQPNFPINLIVHPNREMMVRELTLAKEAGFNMIRTHLLPAAPGFLDLADQMGMLVYSESNLGWIRESPRMLEHCKRDVRALIERDRNHPSVVIWGIYNENPPASALYGLALSNWARSIDPTRVVVDNSGGALAIDQDFGWIDRAHVIPAYQPTPERIQDIHLYLGSPLPRTIYHWLQRLGTEQSSRVLVDEQLASVAVMDEFDRECRTYTGQIFVSELGYGGMSDLDQTVAGFGGRDDLMDARQFVTLRDSLHAGYAARHLERVYDRPSDLYLEAQRLQAAGNRRQIEAVMVNPRVSGYVITQFNDVSYEFHAGIVDLWRNPKLAYFESQRLNLPHVVVMRARQFCALPGEQVIIDLTLVNRAAAPASGMLQVIARDSAGREVMVKQVETALRAGIQPLESVSVRVESAGKLTVAVKLTAGEETLAESTETVQGVEAVTWERLPAKLRCFGQTPAAMQALQLEEAQPGAPSSVLLAALPATMTAVEWDALLDAVENGETALIGALRPDDRLAHEALSKRGLSIELHFGIGSWLGIYHWVPPSNLFEGLPVGGLALEPYTEVVPKYVMTELGGEVHAGSICNTQSRNGPLSMLWYSDIESVRLGKGTLLFSQYRVFEKLDQDPLAARLAFNLLRHAGGQ